MFCPGPLPTMATEPLNVLPEFPKVSSSTSELVIFMSLMALMDAETLKAAEGGSAAVMGRIKAMVSKSKMIGFFLILYILSG